MKTIPHPNIAKVLSLSFAAMFLLTALRFLEYVPVYAQEEKAQEKNAQEEKKKAPEEISPAEEAQEEAAAPAAGMSGADEAKPALWTNTQSGQLYANSSVKFILDSIDNISSIDYIEYSLNESEYVRYSAPITIVKEGPHNISYRAVDRAGNKEFRRSFHVIVDNTPPEVALTPAKAFIEKDGRLFTSPGNTFTIRAADRYSGVKSIRFGVNTPAKQDYDSGRIVQLSEPGSQLIQYEAQDHLGNTSKGGSVLVEVDNAHPVISIHPSHPLRQANGSSYASRVTGFTVSAKDEGAGIAAIFVRIDDSQEWQAYSSTLFFAAEKAHSIAAKAIDAVGNESEVVRMSFIVDDNPPITKLRASIEEDRQEADSQPPL